jgi:signal transduction histidine kinase
MSASVLNRDDNTAAPPPLISKPYSLERRFRMMQAASSALALLLISLVFYWNQTFDRRMQLSLTQLHESLLLSSELHARHESTALAFWEGYFRTQPNQSPAFDEDSRQLKDSIDRFVEFHILQEDRSLVGDLQRQEEDFQSLTARLMAGARNARDDDFELSRVNHFTRQIEKLLHRLEDSEIGRLETLGAERKFFAAGMEVLLIGFAGAAIAFFAWFRRAHTDHLWRHLEQLRGMVAEVRRGNLNVCGEIPGSLELGSLTRAFIQMALELREMRDSLETKVRERTASLELAQKELLQAAKLASLGELVSGVAHEINNPLTSILGFSEVAIGRVESHPEIQGPLRAIRGEALRLRSLVANLSAFARRAPQRRSRIDLRRVFSRFVELRDYDESRGQFRAGHQGGPRTRRYLARLRRRRCHRVVLRQR